MSILSDKEIRARSLMPTHTWVGPGGSWRYFHCVDDVIYEVQTGKRVKIQSDIDEIRAQMRRVTIEEDKNYRDSFPPMIEPFEPQLVRTKRTLVVEVDEKGPQSEAKGVRWQEDKIVSYGLSSYGYDVRCGNEFKVFTNINTTVVDPKNFDENAFVDFTGDVCVIPPNSFALARTVEKFNIPRDILTVCLGKSTYARCGIIVNVTPFEPEWRGYVTLEFSNTTTLPAKIYANEGVAQVIFFKADSVCETSYADRQGKYQDQGAAPICPKV